MLHLTLAYSPDTDDAFMVHALKQDLIPCDAYQFTFISDDIQKLNQEALRGTYDIAAISVAVYPSIAERYWMMPIGASIGDDFGPAVVVSTESPVQHVRDLAGKRVGVPGLQTSAFFAACSVLPGFEPVPLRFDEIGPAVASGRVDAGVLIHELQLNCEDHGFRKLADLGKLWTEKHGLPLPLGANAIRRDLGMDHITEITRLYRESIEYGLNHRRETIAAASRAAVAGLTEEALGDRYIEMYVNERSLNMAADVREAMALLFSIGAEKGLCPKLAGDVFIYENEG